MVLFTFEGLIIVGHKACTYPFLILYLAEIGSSYIRYKLLFFRVSGTNVIGIKKYTGRPRCSA